MDNWHANIEFSDPRNDGARVTRPDGGPRRSDIRAGRGSTKKAGFQIKSHGLKRRALCCREVGAEMISHGTGDCAFTADGDDQLDFLA
jgi:hypothetical protein